ncbi:diaminopimelate decarboxylase [Capsulimonas corticalis]|uniref:Diaminopimelate decarboxylase n=1 Tax=Capsulimonas corticalis TaxID=2219043 RepID=A0A402D0Z0_9BACT|nr:diaminopimelate decarboxylase [Capsulimonas corticalis]BDI31719.1 diaminopimelate decarboxylase [Capsulimonas corticalis]
MLLGTQRVNAEGHLEIGGCDAIDLVKEFGTPLYVMDEETIRENCRNYKAVFEARYPKNDISFASKAFLNMAICKVVEQEGLSLDVASAGELYTAIRAGFPLDRVLLHGNNKSLFELEMAMDFGVGCIVVDNLLELRQLKTLAEKKGKTQKILLRVTPGIDPHTHRRISTGQEDTKFGLSVANGDALEAITEALEFAPHLKITGIHCHIGSQLLDAHTHEQAIDIMVGFMRTIADATGWMPEDLDIGGGLGIRYTEDQHPPSYEEFGDTLIGALRAALEKYDVPEPRLLQEPGRALVGETGTTLYTVGVIKRVNIPQDPGTRTYVTIDGGMSDNPRPQLYDAVYEVLVANRMGEAKDQEVRIAGKHCETDILIQSTKIGHIETGDILAVQSTGAYNYVMASNYNRFTKPACVFVKDGEADLVSRRETLDDVVRLDIIPERLA